MSSIHRHKVDASSDDTSPVLTPLSLHHADAQSVYTTSPEHSNRSQPDFRSQSKTLQPISLQFAKSPNLHHQFDAAPENISPFLLPPVLSHGRVHAVSAKCDDVNLNRSQAAFICQSEWHHALALMQTNCLTFAVIVILVVLLLVLLASRVVSSYAIY